MDITSHFKKGYTTSEFWLTVVSAIVAVAAVFGVELDAGTLAGFAPVAAYVLGRSYLKGKRAQALGDVQIEETAAQPVEVNLTQIPTPDWNLGLDED